MEQNRNKNILWILIGAVGLVIFMGICGVLLAAGLFFLPAQQVTTQQPTIIERAQVDRVAPSATVIPMEPLVIAQGVEDYETAVLTEIYKRVSPSVVNIDVLTFGSNIQQQPFLFPQPQRTPPIPDLQLDPESLFPRGQGSGFVWDGDGHIVTNAHVVEGADQVQIRFSDGTATVAEVIGYDNHSDIAVLRIVPDGYTLVPVARGNLDEMEVGMRVAAIGNPFGFEGTLTSGIVSAIGRSIPALTSFNIPEAIQTDAVINPGNSGGPLLNERGEVIGVNAQIRVSQLGNTGIGFAIPITIVERVVPALIAEGRYEHSYIGISGSTLSPICTGALGLPAGIRGAYVGDILPGTPAARAGLRGGSEPVETNLMGVCPQQAGGDLITAIDGQPVTRFDDILIYLERYSSPGDQIVLTVLRDGEERSIEVTLAARPERP
jgi:serine protease Do